MQARRVAEQGKQAWFFLGALLLIGGTILGASGGFLLWILAVLAFLAGAAWWLNAQWAGILIRRMRRRK